VYLEGGILTISDLPDGQLKIRRPRGIWRPWQSAKLSLLRLFLRRDRNEQRRERSTEQVRSFLCLAKREQLTAVFDEF